MDGCKQRKDIVEDCGGMSWKGQPLWSSAVGKTELLEVLEALTVVIRVFAVSDSRTQMELQVSRR